MTLTMRSAQDSRSNGNSEMLEFFRKEESPNYRGNTLGAKTRTDNKPTFDARQNNRLKKKKKCTFYLSVNVFSTKVLIGDTIFTSPNGDGTAILRGHPSHAKVSPLAVQRKYLHFSVILRP